MKTYFTRVRTGLWRIRAPHFIIDYRGSRRAAKRLCKQRHLVSYALSWE